MKSTVRMIALLVLIAASDGVARAEEAVGKKANDYRPMPWHLVDLWWDIGADSSFESLAMDISISDDVPSSVSLYMAPVGLAHLNKTPFYGGIQTRVDGYTLADPKLRVIGPGFLFSMWGERSVSAIRPSDGGFFQSSGHEGDFVSVRRARPWQKGRYTYRLTRMDQETIDGKPYTWVGAFVHATATNENIFVGALRFPGEKLVLDRKVANFVEIYGARRPVADIPKLTVTFYPPVVNGVPAKRASVEAFYPQGVPDYADAVANEGAVVITVGEPIANRDRRRVPLIGLPKSSAGKK